MPISGFLTILQANLHVFLLYFPPIRIYSFQDYWMTIVNVPGLEKRWMKFKIGSLFILTSYFYLHHIALVEVTIIFCLDYCYSHSPDTPLYILSFISWKSPSGFVYQSKSPHHGLYDPLWPRAMFVWHNVLPPVLSLHWSDSTAPLLLLKRRSDSSTLSLLPLLFPQPGIFFPLGHLHGFLSNGHLSWGLPWTTDLKHTHLSLSI